MRYLALLLTALFLLTGCERASVIISNVDEREANEIIVFLASRGISAEKMPAASTGPGGGEATEARWSISVYPADMTQAMAVLNQNGFPRKHGTTLLDLFAKSGLMSSEREETIRYQAGLAQQITNMLLKIDGVIDANVQLSFPPETTLLPGQQQQKATAAVYIKHQGILDDPNSHLALKIKRLVSGSVNGLDVNDVTVIADRARFADVTLGEKPEAIAPQPKDYVSIWSIVMNKQSASRFRLFFFTLLTLTLLFAFLLGWLVWKLYPILRKKKGFKELLHPIPIDMREGKVEEKK